MNVLQVPLVMLADLPGLVLGQKGGTLGSVACGGCHQSRAPRVTAMRSCASCLREAGYRGGCLPPWWMRRRCSGPSPPGWGAELEISLGRHGGSRALPAAPVAVKARLLADWAHDQRIFRRKFLDAGPTAVLEAENITFVVGTRPGPFSLDVFYAHGQYPRNFDAVVTKAALPAPDVSRCGAPA